MGIIKRGILGGFSNKVANVVGTSWKGRAVIKSLPLSVANPRTTPQVNQRNKFGSAAKFFSVILGIWVKPLWDRFSGDISGYNAIMKVNVDLFDTDGDVPYDFLVMSKGKMDIPQQTSVVADVSLGTVVIPTVIPADVTWGQAGESLFTLVFNSTTGVLLGSDVRTVSPSASLSVTISSTEFVVSDSIYVYSAIKRADGTQVSDTAVTQVIAQA